MILESGEPTDEVIKPEVPTGAEGETAHAGTETLPPRKSRKERAIERATADLRRENEDLKRRLEAERPQRAAQAEAVAARPKPQKADFANDEAFEDALVKWGNEKFAAERALNDAQAAEWRQYEQNLRNYGVQVQEAKGRYRDWDEVVNQEIYIGRDAQLAILEQENGAEVIYYLGKHPDYAKKLGEMRPVSAIRAVERLSASLGAAGGEEYEYRRPRPKVPAPVRTVSTAGSNANPTFAEIAARPNYPGKTRDLKRALAER